MILDSQLRSLRLNYMKALSKLKLERMSALENAKSDAQIETIEQTYLLNKKELENNYKEKQEELIELGNAFKYFGFNIDEDIPLSKVNSTFKSKRFELINTYNQMLDDGNFFPKEEYQEKMKQLDKYFKLVTNYYQKDENGEATQMVPNSKENPDPVSLWISEVEKLPDGKELSWSLEERVNFRDALLSVLEILDEKDPSGDLKKHYMERSLDRLTLGSTYSGKLSWLKLTSEVYLPEDFDWSLYEMAKEDSQNDLKKRS